MAGWLKQPHFSLCCVVQMEWLLPILFSLFLDLSFVGYLTRESRIAGQGAAAGQGVHFFFSVCAHQHFQAASFSSLLSEAYGVKGTPETPRPCPSLGPEVPSLSSFFSHLSESS